MKYYGRKGDARTGQIQLRNVPMGTLKRPAIICFPHSTAEDGRFRFYCPAFGRLLGYPNLQRAIAQARQCARDCKIEWRENA